MQQQYQIHTQEKQPLSYTLTTIRPEIYSSDNYVVFDFETTNVGYGSALIEENSIICVTWRCGKGHKEYNNKTEIAWELNPYDSDSYAGLASALNSADFIVAHNAKFECGWLDRLGLEYWNYVWFDTMLFEYLIQGNVRNPLNLDELAKQYFCISKEPVIKKLMDGGVCPSDMPESLLEKYALVDTEITEMLLNVYQDRIDLFPCAYTKNLFIPVLYDIERNGMVLDAERVKAVYQAVRARYEEAVREMDELTGGINFRSPKQVCEYVYDVLKFTPIRQNGVEVRKANKEVMSKLRPQTQDQKQFLELKLRLSVLEAELSKALNKFIECVENDEGKLSAEFLQHITQTHRIASKGKAHSLQFHNMPKKFKPLFRARHDGWEIVESDQAQLEFRTAIEMARDEQGMKDIDDDFDVHKNTASVLNQIPYDKVTTELRDPAKADTFKPLYGGTRGTDAQMRYYKAFRERYPQIAAMQAGWADTVLVTKELTLPTGLKFYWPNVEMYKSGYIKDTPSIYNYPIQYLATGEVVPIAVIHLWHRMKAAGMQSFIVNTIHDSVVSEVAPEEREDYDNLVQQAFTQDVYDYLERIYNIKWKVPLEAESKGSKFWNDSDKWKKEWLNNE